MDLIFHVILQGHVIKGPFDFMKVGSSSSIPTLPSLVDIGTVVLNI